MTITRQDLGVAEGDLVLDVGCAGGTGTAALAASGCRAVGIELEQHLLDELRADPDTRHLDAVRADATRLPIAGATVPGACVIEVLEHIPSPETVLVELRRVLRPGGRLCVAVPSAYTERAYARLHPRYLTNAGHLHRFERADMTELLERSGFRVERIDTRNLGPALAWYVHALLHTDADPTGRPLQHRWVDVAVNGPLWLLRRIPIARAAVAWLERRLGKSWYFHGVAS